MGGGGRGADGKAAQPVEAVAEATHAVAETAQAGAERAAETARHVTEVSQEAARRQTVPARTARRRGGVFLWIALGALAAFAGLAIVVHGHHQNSVDLHITRRVQAAQRRQRGVARMMRLVSTLGFGPWPWLIPVASAGGMSWLGFRLEGVFMVATGVANLIVATIKLAIARPRPGAPLVDVVHAPLKDYSFPSGHTIQYAAQFGYLAYLAFSLLRPGWLRRGALVACGGLIAAVGPSRIAMGHHWASDVLASYCLGTAFLIGHIGLYRKLKGDVKRKRKT